MSGQEDALVESGGLPPVARGSKGIRARESERESSEIERGGREREREKKHVAGLEVCCRQKLGLVAQATSPEETSEASKLATCQVT